MTLELRGVGRNYGNSGKGTGWAVQDIDLSIADNTVAAILGANGAGKSTLLHLIAGWLPLAAGSISIQGYTLRTASSSVRRRLMLLDEPNVQCSSNKLICQAIEDYRADQPGIEDEIVDWFERLGLVGVYGKSMNSLSKGQRYKVAMICLFVIRPHLWLFDEPFSAGLDANGMALLEAEIQRHAADGGIVLFSSQWPEHANRLADQAIVLHEGRLVHQQSATIAIDKKLVQSATSPELAAVLSGLGRDD